MSRGSGKHAQDQGGAFQDGILHYMSSGKKGKLGLLAGMPQVGGVARKEQGKEGITEGEAHTVE